MYFFKEKIWLSIFSMFWLQSLYAEGRNQTLIGISKNFPVDTTQASFSSEKPSLYLGYHHGIDPFWAAILSIQFRNFYNEKKQHSFSLLSADQAILYKFSLHNSVTLHVGAKLMYLVPVFGPVIPLEREHDFPNEIGAAALIGIRYACAQHWSLYYYVERWRGTQSTRFNGVDTLFAIGFDV